MFLCCIIPQYNSLEIYTTDIFSCPALLVTIFVLWRLLQMDYYLYLNKNITSWIETFSTRLVGSDKDASLSVKVDYTHDPRLVFKEK